MYGTYKGVIFDFNGTLFFDNDKHGLVILRWNINGKIFTNHFIQGQPNYTLDEFEKWYSVLKEIN